MEQVKQLDFTGEKIFAGIDVHKKSWKVSIRTKDMELRMFSQDPSADRLAEHLRKNYPSASYHVVYEAGFCGFGHQRRFAELGVDCIVVHPADVPTSDKDRRRKSDTVDCRKLGQALAGGDLRGIYVPPVAQQEDRGIVRAYHQTVKDQTRAKNRIKGWLHFQGIAVPGGDGKTYWSANFTKWLREIPLSAAARASLDLLIKGYEQDRAMVLEATKQLRLLAGEERHAGTVGLLRGIPGIGATTALLLATEIGDIGRFKGLDQLCDYAGLVPHTHGSSDRERVLGLTHRGNRKLREALIEASWVAVRLDPAMTMAFGDYCKRMRKNRAIIKVARKLLNRIRYVMRNGAPYATAVVG